MNRIINVAVCALMILVFYGVGCAEEIKVPNIVLNSSTHEHGKSNYQFGFYGSDSRYFSNSANVGRFTDGSVARIGENYCKTLGGDYWHGLEIIKAGLEKAGFKVMLLSGIDDNTTDLSNAFGSVNDLTLLEKKRFPLMLDIKVYNVGLHHGGNESSPLIGWGVWTFDGDMWLSMNVVMNVVNTVTGETIDRIVISGDTEKKHIKFGSYTGTHLEIKEGKDALVQTIQDIIGSYYQTLITSVKQYDWQTAMKFANR